MVRYLHSLLQLSVPFYEEKREGDEKEQITREMKFQRNNELEKYDMVTRSSARQNCESENSKAYISTSLKKDFYRFSRMEEITALQEIGCFEIVDRGEAKDSRLYRCTFVDSVKPDGRKRSRLCAAACNDQNHGCLTAAPTIKRMSLRLLFALAASSKFHLFTRDETKAFVMSKTKLLLLIYAQAPMEMKLPRDKVIRIILPLYSMPESPMHWYKTYLDYHIQVLGMKQQPMDGCLLYRHRNGKPDAIIGVQVDDTVFGGGEVFLEIENVKSSEFPSKGRKQIYGEKQRFNGVDASQTDDKLIIDQAAYIS